MNGYGEFSPGKYSLGACFLTEVVMTFFFLFVIIGTTSKGAAVGFAGIPIGLALTLIHLVSIPVTNTSVNPARSTGPALFAGGGHIAQLSLFWFAPNLGAPNRRLAYSLVARAAGRRDGLTAGLLLRKLRLTTSRRRPNGLPARTSRLSAMRRASMVGRLAGLLGGNGARLFYGGLAPEPITFPSIGVHHGIMFKGVSSSRWLQNTPAEQRGEDVAEAME